MDKKTAHLRVREYMKQLMGEPTSAEFEIDELATEERTYGWLVSYRRSGSKQPRSHRVYVLQDTGVVCPLWKLTAKVFEFHHTCWLHDNQKSQVVDQDTEA